MDVKIYYNNKNQAILVTDNMSYLLEQMNLGLCPRIDYVEVAFSKLEKYPTNSIAFEGVDNLCFNQYEREFCKRKFESVSFHKSTLDLDSIVINAEHLILGDGVKINFGNDNFKNLREITFLPGFNFKSKIFNRISTVEKLIIWSGKSTSNELLKLFPDLKELHINRGGLVELSLLVNPLLESLELHYCTKLVKVLLRPEHRLKSVIIEKCRKLDTNNLLGVTHQS